MGLYLYLLNSKVGFAYPTIATMPVTLQNIFLEIRVEDSVETSGGTQPYQESFDH
jgi:hypothetical protein